MQLRTSGLAMCPHGGAFEAIILREGLRSAVLLAFVFGALETQLARNEGKRTICSAVPQHKLYDSTKILRVEVFERLVGPRLKDVVEIMPT